MNFEPDYFRERSRDTPWSQYERCVAELRDAFARDWTNARAEPGLAVPTDVERPSLLVPPSNSARSWAVTPVGMTKLGLQVQRLQRHERAQDHASTAFLVTRHLAFAQQVEDLLFDVARRLSPWGGSTVLGIEWVVSSAGPPTVLDLGVALSTASYSLEEALQDSAAFIAFDTEPAMPQLWCATLADAVRWEIAASMGLSISKSFGPPHDIVGRHFGDLPNPFLQICNLWRCGVVLKTRFDALPVLLAVSAGRL